MKKKNKRNTIILIIVLIAAAAAAVGIGVMLLAGGTYKEVYLEADECFLRTSETEAAIVINGELSEEKAAYENGRIYLPWDLVSVLPGNALYFETSSGTLYLTTQKENRTWTDKSDVLIFSPEGNAYIDAETVNTYSDAEIALYDDSPRAVIRTQWKDIVTAEAKEDIVMRRDTQKRSPIVSEIPAGTSLYCTGTEEEDQSLVYTQDGYSGYVQTSKIDIHEAADLPHESNDLTNFDKIRMDKPVKMIWHYVDVQENNDILDYMLEGTKGIEVICPTWLAIEDKEGNLFSLADKNYVENIKKRGMKVWTSVMDYEKQVDQPGEILKDPARRKHLKDQILTTAKEYGLDGINIDFETITQEQAPDFLQFLRELSVETHKMGIVLSVDNFVPLYTQYYDRLEQSKIVDYIIIMGYDEHTADSSEPGSVASLPFVRQGIEQTLVEVPAQQIILGVPFYTRSWTQPLNSEVFESDALSMPKADQFVKDHDIVLNWNEILGQNYGTASDETSRYSIWMEDALSLEKKLELVNEYGLSGAAAWRLGLESEDVWKVWNKILK